MDRFGSLISGFRFESTVKGSSGLYSADYATVYTELFPKLLRARVAVELKCNPTLEQIVDQLEEHDLDVPRTYGLHYQDGDAVVVHNRPGGRSDEFFDVYYRDESRCRRCVVHTPRITSISSADFLYLEGIPVEWRAIAASVMGPKPLPTRVAGFCSDVGIVVRKNDFQLDDEDFGFPGIPAESPCMVAQRVDFGYESVFPRSGEHVATGVCNDCKAEVAREKVLYVGAASTNFSYVGTPIEHDQLEALATIPVAPPARDEFLGSHRFASEVVMASGRVTADACLVRGTGELASVMLELGVGSASLYGTPDSGGTDATDVLEVEVANVTAAVSQDQVVHLARGHWVLELLPGSIVDIGGGVIYTPKTRALLYGYATITVGYKYNGNGQIRCAGLSPRMWRRAMHRRFGIGVWSDVAATAVLSHATHLYAPAGGTIVSTLEVDFPTLCVAPGVWGVHPGQSGDFRFPTGIAGTVVRSGGGSVAIDGHQLVIPPDSSSTVLVVPGFLESVELAYSCNGTAQVCAVSTLYDQTALETMVRWWIWGPADDPRRRNVFPLIPRGSGASAVKNTELGKVGVPAVGGV